MKKAETPIPTPPAASMHRRTFLKHTAMAATAMVLPILPIPKSTAKENRIGLTDATYAIRWRSEAGSKKYPAFGDALGMLEHGRQIGAGGIQTGVRNWSEAFAGKVRDIREKYGMYLEGSIALPKETQDIPRFEAEVKAAKEAGATILRTVCLSGRRYENFSTPESFQAFKKASIRSLEMAEMVVHRHQAKLAVENHKDWRSTELLAILRHLDSEWIGATLDMGNNFSLLEDPIEVVENLAPFTFTTHFKDMAMQEYEDGFLLSEVPLGKGVLDLKKIIEICLRYNPAVTFNLEMITRDPLQVPCYTDAYWATFETLPGHELAKTLRLIKQHPPAESLPAISHLTLEDRLAFEEQNNRESFNYARKELGFV